MSLTDEQRDIIVRYRIEKSHEFFEDALALAQLRRWNTAGNRLYYAAYQAVTALLVRRGEEIKTHMRIKSRFSELYVKTGMVSIAESRLYSDLFNKRLTGDYTDNYDLTAEDILPLLEPTRAFIAKVETLINQEQ